eukprot:gene675-2106_t
MPIALDINDIAKWCQGATAAGGSSPANDRRNSVEASFPSFMKKFVKEMPPCMALASANPTAVRILTWLVIEARHTAAWSTTYMWQEGKPASSMLDPSIQHHVGRSDVDMVLLTMVLTDLYHVDRSDVDMVLLTMTWTGKIYFCKAHKEWLNPKGPPQEVIQPSVPSTKRFPSHKPARPESNNLRHQVLVAHVSGLRAVSDLR